MSPSYKIRHVADQITLNINIKAVSAPKCEQFTGFCNQAIELFIAEFDNDYENNDNHQNFDYQFDINDFQFVGNFYGNREADKFQNKLKYVRKNKNSSIRLAYRDTGSCAAVGPLKVSYNFCPEVTRGLTTFPVSFATDVLVAGSCVRNAEIDEESSVAMKCNSRGRWQDPQGSCGCSKGYVVNDLADGCQGKLLLSFVINLTNFFLVVLWPNLNFSLLLSSLPLRHLQRPLRPTNLPQLPPKIPLNQPSLRLLPMRTWFLPSTRRISLYPLQHRPNRTPKRQRSS